MNATENEIRIVAKLYEARSAMRGLYADKYPAKIAEYQERIRTAKAKWNCQDDMAATMKLSGEIQGRFPDASGAMIVALLLAAYVEIIEPSTPEELAAA